MLQATRAIYDIITVYVCTGPARVKISW